MKNKLATLNYCPLLSVAESGFSRFNGFAAHLQLHGKFNKLQQATCYGVSMGKKLTLTIALLIALAVSVPVAVSAEVSVGVKAGNWIEYQVTFTGMPPEGHDVEWARMDITSVQGKDVSLVIAAKLSNGTWLNETVQLNLETGQLGDDFIVPAELNSGDVFFDMRQGNITISGVEEGTYAGAERTVMVGTTAQTTYYWDRATGVLVEGNSSYTDFSMYTKVDKTNMWQVQAVGWDATVVYAVVVGVAVVVVAVATVFLLRRKKGSSGFRVHASRMRMRAFRLVNTSGCVSYFFSRYAMVTVTSAIAMMIALASAANAMVWYALCLTAMPASAQISTRP